MPRPRRRRILPVARLAQPDLRSCGPTCLAMVMGGAGTPASVDRLIAAVRRGPEGGTQAVDLAHLALDYGYHARLYPFGVRVFDPTWWEQDRGGLIACLDAREAALAARGASEDERSTVRSWRTFLARGGHVAFAEPSASLLVRVLDRGRPVVCGVSATWLYRDARERPDDTPDPIGGEPVGHFVVVRGYTGGGLHFHIADPAEVLPDARSGFAADTAVHGEYPLPASRLLHAVLLGDTTRDAVLLELWRGPERS